MTCPACEESRTIDGITPDCETAKGCVIPPLSEAGNRILTIRQKLAALGELIGRGEILRLYGVTLEDMELLELVEAELRQISECGQISNLSTSEDG